MAIEWTDAEKRAIWGAVLNAEPFMAAADILDAALPIITARLRDGAIERVAAAIRAADGNHTMGAGALAEVAVDAVLGGPDA